MIISIGNDFFMQRTSISFKHDEKWWKNDGFWLIYVRPIEILGVMEFNIEGIGFWSRFSSKFSTTPCSLSVQRVGVWPVHEVDFQNRFLDTQWWYGLTLLGPKRLGSASEISNVNMTVNGFQKFKNSNFRKPDLDMAEAWGWLSKSISRYTVMIWTNPLGSQTIGKCCGDFER